MIRRKAEEKSLKRGFTIQPFVPSRKPLLWIGYQEQKGFRGSPRLCPEDPLEDQLLVAIGSLIS